MGKLTIAECVETEALAQCLVRVEVDFMQGYLIGRPEPTRSLEAHLFTERAPVRGVGS